MADRPTRPMRMDRLLRVFMGWDSEWLGDSAPRDAGRGGCRRGFWLMDALPVGPSGGGFAQTAVAEVVQGLVDLPLGVHHEGPVLRNRLAQRLSGDQQGACRGVGRGLDDHAIGPGVVGEDGHTLRRHGPTGNLDAAPVHVDEGVMPCGQRLFEASM